MGVSLLLVAQAYYLRSSILDFFANDGLIQGDLSGYLGSAYTPKIGWLVERLAPLKISETTCVYFTSYVYLISVLALLAGFHTRAAAIATWFLHWVFMNTGNTTSYGVDLYAHVFLFYLIFVPAGNAWSLDVLLGRKSALPSTAARIGIRILQLHLCISYFCSGVEKAVGIQWWNGELLWRAVSLPVYQQFDMTWLARWSILSKLGGWATLFLELGYCVFIWPKTTRPIWVVGMIGLHLGIAIFLGLGLFGLMMCVLTLAIFGFSAEPKTLTEKYIGTRRFAVS
jgi:hypothetical protein